MNKVEANTDYDISALREKVRMVVASIPDPEIPVITIADLGILRNVQLTSSGGKLHVEVTITPTYSGCPAMDIISMQIRMALLENGFDSTKITSVLSPAWTTDWMTAEGKEKLKAFGIAPPNPSHSVCEPALFQQEEAVQCPRCNSFATVLVSQFGSTPCKAQYQCKECLEPFDYFKCH